MPLSSVKASNVTTRTEEGSRRNREEFESIFGILLSPSQQVTKVENIEIRLPPLQSSIMKTLMAFDYMCSRTQRLPKTFVELRTFPHPELTLENFKEAALEIIKRNRNLLIIDASVFYFFMEEGPHYAVSGDISRPHLAYGLLLPILAEYFGVNTGFRAKADFESSKLLVGSLNIDQPLYDIENCIGFNLSASSSLESHCYDVVKSAFDDNKALLFSVEGFEPENLTRGGMTRIIGPDLWDQINR